MDKTGCYGPKAKVRLTNYIATLAFDANNNPLAVRFSGYPEQVEVMVISILSILCGAEYFTEMEMFGRERGA